MTFTYTLTQQDLSSLVQPLAEALRPGDVIALWGDLGVGKTTFARILIQTMVGQDIDVPSPTFTLVQAYDTPQGEVWHCDLYRLKDPEEVFELGLEDAFHEAICLIEWPERLADLLPRRRIDITFKIVNETTREITITIVGPHESLKTLPETTS
ncbi:MAG: tRNA (adenosine(37)-N6)-threonylcarbamoyltransferase complex ATPase subunit type 1 TsaE [Alphaproteobacteria bacterium]|jgi:tRNA threonylcarbamoyladenosine biosynthesis protein TsaE|nr:tRNA (adenosine(37)-N6)-threonylcarbamoyltransferase complex ATPase subunit type 1 TsaE [Alphaproteobacteria bacterium]